MKVDLNGKVVIVTGASEGIGREAAFLFAEEGAYVALAARREKLLISVLNALRGGQEKHISCRTDISNEEEVERLVSDVMRRYGRIDILVNNAAVSYVGRVKDMDLEIAENTIDINLLGTIRVTRQVLTHMLEQKSGHIINISSIIGRRGVPYRSIYCASKFGMEGFMESLRSETYMRNIKVSIIRPPSVRTDFSNKVNPDIGIRQYALDSLDPRTVAKVIVDVAKRPRRDVNMGFLAKCFLFLNGVLPVLFDKITREK